MDRRAPLFFFLLVYLLVGTLYAVYTPDWQAPDEPAHYNYVRQLANGRFPVMAPGDFDEAYLNEIKAAKFAPRYSIASIEYEDWQPPLYYLLQTPVFWLSGGSLLALRVFSLVLGAGVVVLAYGVARLIFTGQAWVALTTAVFVAFLPQHVAILASANNDSLAELLIAAILFVLVGMAKTGTPTVRSLFLLGLLLGLGFLTKATVYFMVPVAALVLLWRFWGRWRALWRAGLRVAAPALLLGLVWWGRNAAVYGGLDILGKATHDRVAAGQLQTADLVADIGVAETVRQFLQTTFNSFWGQFGWMGVPMPGWIYQLLWLFSGLVLAGLLLVLIRRRRRAANGRSSPFSSLLFWMMAGTFILALGSHVIYNLRFVQHQGRYLFPALIPVGLGVALGVGEWIRPLLHRWPFIASLIPVGLAIALVGLDLLALFRFIVPALAVAG